MNKKNQLTLSTTLHTNAKSVILNLNSLNEQNEFINQLLLQNGIKSSFKLDRIDLIY